MKKAPMVFEMLPYQGYYTEHLATAGKAHSLLNAETEVANGMHKEMLLADLQVTADKLEAEQDWTSSMWLKREAKRLA